MTRDSKDASFQMDTSYYKMPQAYWSILPYLTGAELKILLVLVQKCQFWNDPQDTVLLKLDASAIAEATGLQERSIWRPLDSLAKKKIIIKRHYRTSDGHFACQWRLAKAKDTLPRADQRAATRGPARHGARSSAPSSETPRARQRMVEDQNSQEDNRDSSCDHTLLSVPPYAEQRTATRGPARHGARSSAPPRAEQRAVHISKNPIKNPIKKEEGETETHSGGQGNGSSSSISPSFDLQRAFASQQRAHPWLDLQEEWERYSGSCAGKGRTAGRSGFKQWIDIEIERKGVFDNGRSAASEGGDTGEPTIDNDGWRVTYSGPKQ